MSEPSAETFQTLRKDNLIALAKHVKIDVGTSSRKRDIQKAVVIIVSGKRKSSKSNKHVDSCWLQFISKRNMTCAPQLSENKPPTKDQKDTG